MKLPLTNRAPGLPLLSVLGFQDPWHSPGSGLREVESGQVTLPARPLAALQGISKDACVKKSSSTLQSAGKTVAIQVCTYCFRKR